MDDLKFNILAILFLVSLAIGMIFIVQAAKKNRSAAGVALALAMLFGSNWVQPPPKPEIEDLDKAKDDQGKDDDPPAASN